jgi:hypothetical protein
MINLNDSKFATATSKVFNNGKAGVAQNVTVSVSKRGADEAQNRPDFKITYTDAKGGTVDDGIYLPKADDQGYEGRVDRLFKKLVAIVKATLGEDYKFPGFKSEGEAFKALFKIINDNSGATPVNVLVTYGSQDYPKKYLTVRGIKFIEKYEEGEVSSLELWAKDLAVRPEANDGEDRVSSLTPATQEEEDDDFAF